MITLLAVDFDETVTVRDTTPCLHELAASRLPLAEGEALRQRWRIGAEAYNAEWQAIFRKALSRLDFVSDPYRALSEFVAAFDSVEQTTIEAVVAGGFLRGIPRAALQAVGARAEKRKDALETLAKAKKHNIPLYVISANWSQDIVRGGVDGLDVPIYSNDLTFDENNISTGELNRKIVSAFDKLREFRALPSGEGLRVFVGDSVTDLLALLEADIGILVGEKTSPRIACERTGIEIVPLTPDATPKKLRLYHTASWESIARFLFNNLKKLLIKGESSCVTKKEDFCVFKST